MTDYEKKGYDSWVELWAVHACPPSASQCPAVYMKDGQDRSDFIKGWSRAMREHRDSDATVK